MGRAAVWWTVGMVAAAVVGTASGAGPASADVTLTPTQAVRGESVKLTFRVTEDRGPAHTTRVEMRLPDATPIAETTPMSVPGWAPRVATRTLDQPLEGMHHGRTSEVVTAITWFRADDATEGAPVELTVSLGPLPEVGHLMFTVLQTYSDGVVTRWDQQPAADASRPAPVLTLLPAGPAPAGAAPGPQTQDATPTADEPGGFGPLVVGTAAGLLGGVAVTAWVFLRRRRSVDGDGDSDSHGDGDGGGHRTEPPVDAGAGTGPVPGGGVGRPARAWRLRE